MVNHECDSVRIYMIMMSAAATWLRSMDVRRLDQWRKSVWNYGNVDADPEDLMESEGAWGVGSEGPISTREGLGRG